MKNEIEKWGDVVKAAGVSANLQTPGKSLEILAAFSVTPSQLREHFRAEEVQANHGIAERNG